MQFTIDGANWLEEPRCCTKLAVNWRPKFILIAGPGLDEQPIIGVAGGIEYTAKYLNGSLTGMDLRPIIGLNCQIAIWIHICHMEIAFAAITFVWTLTRASRTPGQCATGSWPNVIVEHQILEWMSSLSWQVIAWMPNWHRDEYCDQPVFRDWRNEYSLLPKLGWS